MLAQKGHKKNIMKGGDFMGKGLYAQFFNSMQTINMCNDTEKRTDTYNSITGESKESTNKKDFKNLGISDQYIFSRNTLKNYLSISKDFSKFLKSEYGINRVYDIKPEMALNFLQQKQENGSSAKTLQTYKLALVKLNIAVEKTYKCKGYCWGKNNIIDQFKVEKPQTTERRLDNEKITQILENYKGKYSLVMKIQADLGLRVNEVKNLDIDSFNFTERGTASTRHQQNIETLNTVHLTKGTKGGLERYVPIPQDKVQEYREIIDQFRAEGQIKPFKDLDRSNYDKAIKRQAEKLGFGSLGSSHEFRKFYASMRYETETQNLNSEKEKREIAKNIVRDLGHSRERNDLIHIYIGI